MQGQKARIAFAFNECENRGMKKTLTATLTIITAGMLLAGYAKAKQTPAASASQAPAASSGTPQTPAANSPAVPAKKTGQAPAAKTPGAPGTKSPAVLTLKTEKDKNSYAFGMN